jgi:hypothetical protein
MYSFKKTISGITFSPGTFDQISFYSSRLKQEESVRRLGLVLIVITMFVQLFAAMVPAEKSLAADPDNDVIVGGVNTIGELNKKCNDRANVQALYARFGLACTDIKLGSVQNTDFAFKDQGQKLTRTVGRVNYATTADNNLGSFAGTTYYSRSAGEWSGSTPAYFFGRHKGTDNNYYYVWVLKDCGNIAYRKADSADTITPQQPIAQLAPTPTLPPPTPPVTSTAPQTVACVSLTADRRNGIKTVKVKFQATYSASPPSAFSGLTFNFGDGNSIRQLGTSVEHTYVNSTDQPVTYSAYLVVHSPLGDQRGPACEVSITVAPETCEEASNCLAPERTKRVTNVTQSLSSSKTLLTKAKASDVMEYSLITTNSNAQPVNGYAVRDYIGDLLDYANLDESFLKSQGGIFSPPEKTITWTDQTISAKSTLEKKFRVVLKNPLPSTNRPNASSDAFDCKMQNGYGDKIVISVDCSVVKTVEQLPNTGPGTALAAAFTLSTISGYFVARARLLAKELGIIKRIWRS